MPLNPLYVLDCPGLQCAQAVRQLRFQAQLLLDEATSEQRGRFGELLLLLTTLQSVAWQMVEQLQLMRLLGKANVDSLLMEMLLGEEAARGSESLHVTGKNICHDLILLNVFLTHNPGTNTIHFI